MTIPTATRADSGTNWLAGVVFVVSVIALVTLEVLGRDTTALMVLVGPVVTGLLIVGNVNKRTAEVHDSVRRVEAQTNGVMDGRIAKETEASVRKVLSEAGVLQVHQPAPVTVNVPPPASTP